VLGGFRVAQRGLRRAVVDLHMGGVMCAPVRRLVLMIMSPVEAAIRSVPGLLAVDQLPGSCGRIRRRAPWRSPCSQSSTRRGRRSRGAWALALPTRTRRWTWGSGPRPAARTGRWPPPRATASPWMSAASCWGRPPPPPRHRRRRARGWGWEGGGGGPPVCGRPLGGAVGPVGGGRLRGKPRRRAR